MTHDNCGYFILGMITGLIWVMLGILIIYIKWN
jgi:hypothetical protein